MEHPVAVNTKSYHVLFVCVGCNDTAAVATQATGADRLCHTDDWSMNTPVSVRLLIVT